MKYDTVRRFALALADTTEAPHHHFGSFRIKGRIFVTVPPDREHLHVFVGEQDREVALAVHPEFAEKLLWGGKVVGIKTLFDHLEAGDALEVFLDDFPSVSRELAIAVLEEARASLTPDAHPA